MESLTKGPSLLLMLVCCSTVPWVMHACMECTTYRLHVSAGPLEALHDDEPRRKQIKWSPSPSLFFSLPLSPLPTYLLT